AGDPEHDVGLLGPAPQHAYSRLATLGAGRRWPGVPVDRRVRRQPPAREVHDLVVVDVPGRGHNHIAQPVTAGVEGRDLLPGQGEDALPVSRGGPGERIVGT